METNLEEIKKEILKKEAELKLLKSKLGISTERV